MNIYSLSDETKHLVILLVLVNNVFNAVAFPCAGPLGNGLRAAGDVKFTMIVSIALTVGARLLFSVVLGLCFNLQVMYFGRVGGLTMMYAVTARRIQAPAEMPEEDISIG